MERHYSPRRPATAEVVSMPRAQSFQEEEEETKRKRRRRRLWLTFRYYECQTRWQRITQTNRVQFLLLCVTGFVTLLVWWCLTHGLHRHQSTPSRLRTVIPRQELGKTRYQAAEFCSRPRVLGMYLEETTGNYNVVRRVVHDSSSYKKHSRLIPSFSAGELARQRHIREDSKDYYDGMRDDFEHDDCKAQYDWQLESYPNCNNLHEVEVSLTSMALDNLHRLGNGYWREIWKVVPSNGTVVLKTLRYRHEWDDRNFDRHRRDAVAMERLTSSPHVVDIYSYCGNSALFEYADKGDLEDVIWYSKDGKKWNSTDRLIVAHQVASAIADVHSLGDNRRPSIVHADITTSQFVNVNGRYKLNDFNRCRFIAWNTKTNQPCGFNVGQNPGNFRSPEEYKYEAETEKIDVYSMGNIFYVLLTELWPFNDEDDTDKVQRKVINGERPHISHRIRYSTDPADQAMLQAMKMSWRQNPKVRATAREVADYLQSQLEAIKVIVPSTTK